MLLDEVDCKEYVRQDMGGWFLWMRLVKGRDLDRSDKSAALCSRSCCPVFVMERGVHGYHSAEG